jgi:gliding motility-associated lipoprotein GldH
MLKKNSLILSLILLVSVFSCGDNAVFDEYRSVTTAWNENDIVSFKMNPNDTVQPYNLFLNIRNTEAYRFNNLFLIVEMDFPNGKIIKDTLEYRMAHKSGKLMGEGFGAVKANKLWYKEAVKFKESGNYQVKIQHAMRKSDEIKGITNLQGITDVGFRIEKTKTN